MDPTSGILDSPQPEETFPYQHILEQTLPHTAHRAPVTSHWPICQHHPRHAECFITAQQLLRGPGSKWGHMAPTLADFS